MYGYGLELVYIMLFGYDIMFVLKYLNVLLMIVVDGKE